MARRLQRAFVFAAAILALGTIAHAQTSVTLAWDANPEPNIAAYIVSYGTQPRAVRAYSTTVNVATQTQWIFTPPVPTDTYYFAVQARNDAGLTSNYSAEVVLEPTGTISAPPGSVDFNQDGRIDLLWQHDGAGWLAAWYMTGTAMVGSTALTPNQVTDTNWKIVGMGDFNADGQADILWQHQQTRLMTVWLMNGSVFLRAGLLSNNTVSDQNWEVRAVADMNRDDWPDLVWQHRTEGWITTWIMNGLTLVEGRSFSPNRVADTNWKVAGVGDFNGDGQNDLLWQHQLSGTITSWLLNGFSLSSPGVFYPTNVVSDTNWQIRGVGDLNADGKPDIIWQHRVQGLLVGWLMNGTTLIRGAFLDPDRVSDNNWRIVAPK